MQVHHDLNNNIIAKVFSDMRNDFDKFFFTHTENNLTGKHSVLFFALRNSFSVCYEVNYV